MLILMFFSSFLNHPIGRIIALLFHLKLINPLSFTGRLIHFRVIIGLNIINKNLVAGVIPIMGLILFEWRNGRFINTVTGGLDHSRVVVVAVVEGRVGEQALGWGLL